MSVTDALTELQILKGVRIAASRAVKMVAVIVVIVALLISLPVVPDQLRKAIDDIVQALAAGLAIAACLQARQRTTGRSRTGWSTLGAGMLLWGLGQIYWIVIEVVLQHKVPSPSLADIGFVFAIPLDVVGLLFISFPSSRLIERVGTAVDGVLIVLSLWLIAYLVVLKDLIPQSHATRLATVVSLIYPIGDIVLITIVLLAFSQGGPLLHRTLILIVGATVSLTVSDCFFAVTTVSGHYKTGRIFDIGWTAGWLLLAVAAASARSGEDTTGNESRIQAAVPYLLLLVAVVVTTVYFLLGHRTNEIIRWTGVGIIFVTLVGLLAHRERMRQAGIWREHQITHDPLTDLPNYVGISSDIEGLLRSQTPFGLLYCDIDRLDAVNSSLGREAGDLLLLKISSRLREALPGNCHLARCGGDEFTIVCLDLTDSALTELAEQVASTFERPFEVGDHVHAVSITIGVVNRGLHHQHADQLVRDGLQAMLRAKAGGRRGIAIFDSTFDHPWTVDDLELEGDLRTAIQMGDQLFPLFQPIVQLSDKKIVGYEALVRWRHPDRGLLNPGAFIGLAETTGLVVPLGWWMLDTVCSEFATGDPDKWVSVNVAGAQLGTGELVPAVIQALEKSGLRPEQLHLEITETQLVNPTPDLLDELAAIHSLGVALSLDDFGTGYSSVALLRDLSIQTIKIDLSFTNQIETNPQVAGIVRGLISFCDQIKVDVIAEGVETPGQHAMLQAFDCPFAQGYLYGRPGSIDRDLASTQTVLDVQGSRLLSD